MLDQAQRYIDGVLSGEIVACDLIKKAVQRHLNDLERIEAPGYPYYFSEVHAGAAIAFFKLLRHTKGQYGKRPFNLQDNQAFALAMLFGWRHKESNTRRFTKAYLEMARKNGKSEFAAGVQLFCVAMEGEHGAEGYSAATTRDQARIVFDATKSMARSLKHDYPRGFGGSIDTFSHAIIFNATEAFVKAVSSDAHTLDGLNPHVAIIDEYHAHPRNLVLNVMKTGMGSRTQPLLLVITTAGFDKSGPCYTEERKVAIDVLNGDAEQDNLLALIYTLDDGDDWQDESVWIKANPNLGVTPTLKYMRESAREASIYGGSYLVEFLTKNLNLWVDAPKTWIPKDVWDENGGEINEAELEGRLCFGGIDLASVSDFTSFSLFFPARNENERHIIIVRHFLPESALAKDTRSRFATWKGKGELFITPGNTTDYNFLLKQVVSDCERFNVQSIQIDRANSSQFRVQLQEQEGISVEPFGQGYLSMSTPSKEWEKMLGDRKLNHGNTPVLAWMNGNVSIDRDAADNIKPNKDKSGDKIDGIVASIMAVGGWLTYLANVPSGSYLDENDLAVL